MNSDIENFVVDLLNDIKEAGCNNENFDLHLEASVTKEMASEIDNIKWIEIY